jgi:hypothetical protein
VIDIADDRHPSVVSNLRLAVQMPNNLTGPQAQDPNGNTFATGYEAHYCSIPRRVNPDIVACSMIKSGLRVFDIRNPRAPREVAYFNMPVAGNSNAVSSVGFDEAHKQLWYSDSGSGFWAVQLQGVAAAAWRNSPGGVPSTAP